MNVDVKTVQQITLIALTGELTARTAPDAQQRILGQAPAGGKTILDMSGVSYLSSAGLRLLLVVYRRVAGSGGRAMLVGLNDDLKNTMSVTGFLDFFTHRDTLEAGIAALNS